MANTKSITELRGSRGQNKNSELETLKKQRANDTSSLSYLKKQRKQNQDAYNEWLGKDTEEETKNTQDDELLTYVQNQLAAYRQQTDEKLQARQDAIKLATQDKTAAERNQEDLNNLPEGAYDYVENNKKESTLNNIVYNMTKNSDKFKTINNIAALAKSNVSEMLQSEYGMDQDKADYYEENWDTIKETKTTNDYNAKQEEALKNIDDNQYDLLEKLAKAQDINKHPRHEVSSLTYKQAQQYIKDIPETLKSQYGMSDEQIEEYTGYVSRDANKKNYETTQEKMENLVEEHPVLGRAALSGLSFATNIKGGFDSFVATAESKLTDSDTPIDPYSSAYEGTNLSNLAKSTVENSIDSTAGKYIYNAIQSSAESLPYFLIGGGVVEGIGLTGKAAETAAKLISYPLFSSSAFGSAFVQKKQQGLSDKQAFIYSVSAGAAEAISEELGFDGMFKVVSGKVTGKELAKLFAKNGIAEGLEEISSDIWNTIADQIINGDYSDLSMDIYNLQRQGYSEEEAKKVAAKNLVMQYIEDGIVGALSGLIFTGVGVGTTKIGYHNLSKYASDETVQNAADTALNSETAKGSTAREIAEQMAANNQTASDLSTKQKAQMFESLAQLQDEEIDNSINKALESRIDNQDTIDKAKSLFDEYRNSNMTDKQFEERVVNEVAKNNQERDAILEARDEAFSVNIESNPIVNAVNSAVTDKKVNSYNKAVEKQNAKEQKQVEKRYNEFTKAEEQGKSVKERYSKLKGVTEVTTKDGVTTKIKGIGKVAGANTTVVLEDGKTVKYTDVDYSDAKMGKLYNEVSSLPSTQLANIVIDNYSGEMNVEGYVRAVKLAYESGQLSKSTKQTLDNFVKNMNNSNLLVNVSNMSAIKEAYMSGANSVEERKLPTKASKVTEKHIEQSAEENAKADDNLALTKAATGLALKSVIETKQYLTNNHEQIVASIVGSYKEGRVQLKAEGKNVYRTLLHENIAEKIKAENPEGYMQVADAILKYMIDTNGNEYVLNQLQRYGIEYTLADNTGEILEVADEYVNDCIAGLFSTPTGTQSYVDYVVSKLPERAQKILGTLKDIADRLLEEIRKFLDSNTYMTAGAKDGYQMAEENAVKIRELILNKLDEIDQANGSKEALDKVGVEYDSETESVNPASFSVETWNLSDYVTDKKNAAKEMAAVLGISERKATAYINNVNSIAKVIADDKVRLDYEDSEGVSSFVSNAEYGGSIDFSTICKKRRLLTGTFSEIQKALPDTALSAEDVLKIRKMMDDKGYEVSCGLCYVEGSRVKMGKYTKEFLNEYAKNNPSFLPNMAQMNTPDGIEDIRINHPDVYEAYKKFMNKLAQRKPKLFQMATAYKGEVLNKFSKESNVEEKNKNGGLRLQSFSDFEIIHLIDCMQVIMDMSRVGLAGQAYTKVPDFAYALGNTGLKINLSLIAKDVDENGNLVLDEKEGMKRSDAEKLRNMYSDNVGTILVTFNDEQLKAALNDDFIDFIIPFHRSQWRKDQYKLMGLPQTVKDYTNKQNERYLEAVYNKNGKKMRPSNYMPNTYWNFNISGKANAENYLKECALNNRIPKFSNLLVDNKDGSYSLQPDGSTDGYWKLLIDFKMYNNKGKGVPQQAVKPDFNMQEAERMLNEYQGGHESFPVAQDVVDEFLKTKKKKNTAKFSVEVGMSDEERFNELKDQFISVAEVNKNLIPKTEVEFEELKLQKEKEIKNFFVAEGDVLGLYKTYSNPELDFEISFTRNGMKESVNKQYKNRNYNVFKNFSELLTCADSVVENAVLLETHEEDEYISNNPEHKYNKAIKQTYVFVSAYSNDENIIPVKMTVIEYKQKDTNLIHVLMVMNEIKKDEVTKTADSKSVHASRSSFEYSLADILNKVKNDPYSDDLGKYIPEQFRVYNSKDQDKSLSVDVDSDQYAPVFYSKMENEISGIKTDKIGAASLIPYLKGKGVKDEEIKWSGIATFLEGKKSVTKEELQEFLKANELVVEEETLSDTVQEEMEKLEEKLTKKAEEVDFYYNPDDYIEEMDGSFRYNKLIRDIEEAFEDNQISKEDENSLLSIAKEMKSKLNKAPKWKDFTSLKGKYSEILFKLPESDYSNFNMDAHWNRPGVLAHARVTEVTSDNQNMLFVEEIQSDWHNAGNIYGYAGERSKYIKNLNEIVKEFINSKTGKIIKDTVKDEPFIDSYLEDFISDDVPLSNSIYGLFRSHDVKFTDEMYKEIKEFRQKYENIIDKANPEERVPDAPYSNGKYVEYVMKRLLRMAAEDGYDAIGWTTGKMQEERWSDKFAEGYRIEYDQDIPKFMSKYGKQWGAKVEKDNVDGNEIWKVNITPEMKQSVLFEGQAKFSVDIPEYDFPRTVFFKGTDEEIAAAEAKEEEIKDVFRNIVNQPDFQALRVKKEGYKYPTYYILHHSTRPGMEYQLSYYDKTGPIGHAEFIKGDEEEMYKRLLGLVIHEKNAKVEVLPEDIENRKFSVEVDDDLSLFEAIIAENEEIKEASDVIKSTVQSMGNTKIKAADVRKIASSIKAEYKSNVSVDDITESLTDVFKYMDQDNVNYDALVQIMSEIAKPILENATTTNSTRSEQWDKFSGYLRSTRFKLTNGQIREVASEYGNYDNYRKRLFGVTTISREAEASLDDIWSELVDASGNTLPAYVAAEDEPAILLETIEGLKPQVVTENTYGMNLEQASYDLALDIYGRYFTAMANVNRSAEIQQAVGKVKAKQVANRRKAVEKYKQKLEEQKKLLAAEKQKNIKALAEEIKDAKTDLEQAVRENNEIAAAVIEDLKDKNQKRIEQIRKQKDDQIAKIKAQNFDARKNERDKRKNTALKEQLRNQTNALNKMLKSPNIANFVKVSMVSGTIDVLEAINLDTGKSKNMKDKLARLSEMYARYRDTKDAKGNPVFLGFDYDENTWQMIEDLRKTFEDRNYTELSNDELQKVVEIVIRLKTQIQNAGKLLQNEKYQDAFKTAKEIVGEIKDSDGSDKNRAQELMDDYFSVQLNAYRWFRKTSGYKDGAMMSIYKQLDDGQLKMISMQKEVNDMFTDLLEGEENQENVKRLLSTDDKDMVDIGLKVDGKTFKVPRGMLLHYLMSIQNDDNARHLVLSGFAVPDLELYAKGKYERAYKKSTIGQFYTFEDIKDATENIKFNRKDATMEDGIAVATKRLQALSKKLRAQLTPWEEDYLQRTEHLFHEYLGAKLNEVTIETRGYALAQVKNYYPINVDKKFTQTEFAGLKVDGTLEGMGFLKERVKASNPIILEDVASVILRQTNSTARYYGFAIPVRNLNMLMGIKKVDGYKNIESTLSDKWGTTNVKILKNMITDIQTGRKDDELLTKTMNALRGNFAAATLTANLGVGIKQTASIPTAIAVLGRKAVNRALLDTPKAFKGKGIEELEAINPLLWSRTNGNTSADLQYAQKSDMYKWMDNKIPTSLKNWTIDIIQYMDKSAVTTLEYASKYYVDENFKDLKEGTEEYWNKVSEMFTKTVEETQPNYTVLQRPEVLKTTNQLAKQLFMFKTQPMQNLGIVYDALGEFSAVKKRYAKDTAEYKKAADNLARAVGSQLAAAFMFSLATVIANVAYHKLWKYDQDDDKKWYWEVATAVASGMASTLAGSLICGDWIYSALTEILFGATNYGVEVSIVEGINNAVDYINNFKEYGEDLANAITEADKETYTKKLIQNTEDVLYAISEFIGIPAKNIINDVKSPILYITEFATKSPIGSLNMPWDNTPASQYQRMYEALLENDTERYKKLFDQQKKKALAEYAKKEEQSPDYNPETGINNKIKSMIQSDYNDGIITADEAIKYLDRAGISYDDNIIDAWDYKNETGNSSYTDYSRMKDAIADSYENGADRSAITTEIKKLLKNGKDKGAIAQVITNEYKSVYLENKNSSLKNLLITCYMACGYTREEAVEKIEKWSK